MKKIIGLLGPTASGKTDLALSLAQEFPLEIISVDSALVYRGLDIGTAKPSREILKAVPHHLIDICDVKDESYSAAHFIKDATRAIEDIQSRGKIPFLVGGTSLYFKALQSGLTPMPETNPEIRQKIQTEAEILGWAAMHQKLHVLDPLRAQKIHPNDPQRITRALEIIYSTNSPIVGHWEKDQKTQTSPYQFFAILPKERQELHARIAQRFEIMLDEGIIEETQWLLDNSPPDHPTHRMVGYRQVMEYLSGQIDKKTMIDKAVAATRQLAKRQSTWLNQPNHWTSEIVTACDAPSLKASLQAMLMHMDNDIIIS